MQTTTEKNDSQKTEGQKTALLYIHPGMADWEAAFVLPEIAASPRYQVRAVGETSEPVRTMGGLRVLPDVTLDALSLDDVAVLILPGGDGWTDPANNPGAPGLIRACLERKIPIAAICAGTVALAREGLLDDIRHTSNDLAWLKAVTPGYRGEARYAKELAVTDGGIVTASGIGALEFTRELLKLLEVHDEERTEQWYQLFKNGVVPAWLGG